jgi:hypothetical protein
MRPRFDSDVRSLQTKKICGNETAMSIATLAAIGEFVGGLAVLGTLIYLAYQTKISVRMHEQSIRDLSSQMVSENANGWASFFLETALDERLATIVGKLKSAQALEDSELASAEQYLTGFLIRLENLEHQRNEGAISGIDNLLEKQIGLYSESTDFRRWWAKESQVGFSDWFVQAVNSILEKNRKD